MYEVFVLTLVLVIGTFVYIRENSKNREAKVDKANRVIVLSVFMVLPALFSLIDPIPGILVAITAILSTF